MARRGSSSAAPDQRGRLWPQVVAGCKLREKGENKKKKKKKRKEEGGVLSRRRFRSGGFATVVAREAGLADRWRYERRAVEPWTPGSGGARPIWPKEERMRERKQKGEGGERERARE